MLNRSALPRLGGLDVDTRAVRAGSVAIRCIPDVREFAISDEPAMPAIQVQASVVGVTPDPTPGTMFEWAATLQFDPRECRNGVARPFPPVVLNGASRGGAFAVRFTDIQGGRLTIRVRARVGADEIVGERADLRIIGTNPRYAQLADALPSRVFKALVWRESGARQFLGRANGGTAACPLFSRDRLGGVGLMQLTRPAPTREQTWNWRANVAAGLALFQDKVRIARAYPAQYRRSAAFQTLVTEFNAERARNGLPPVEVTIPEYTQEQVELDALRGYNGYSAGLHEFRAARDATGRLVVDLAPGGRTGTARWEQISGAERRAALIAAGVPESRRGDPDYVDHVMGANVPF